MEVALLWAGKPSTLRLLNPFRRHYSQQVQNTVVLQVDHDLRLCQSFTLSWKEGHTAVQASLEWRRPQRLVVVAVEMLLVQGESVMMPPRLPLGHRLLLVAVVDLSVSVGD
jgi:hypothetical protein